MRKLRAGWYVLLYHEISWEENAYIRSLGSTCPPDIFREHVKTLSSAGELVSIAEGERRLRTGIIDAPIFSFWFDDGFSGVPKYAMPILEEFGTSAAISICSRFLDRNEFFWRFKLSYLNSIDAMRLLRSLLRRHGYAIDIRTNMKAMTLDEFSHGMLHLIEDLFTRCTTSRQRNDAFRMFIDADTVVKMLGKNWIIANHTAAHYPVGQEHSLHELVPQFGECEERLASIINHPTQYWVLPFDVDTSSRVLEEAGVARGNRYMVYCGNRKNTPEICNSEKILYRIYAPIGERGGKLIERLNEVQYQ